MTATEPLQYRWNRDEFVRAWEAGVFDRRVELIEGEVWEVPIGTWHAETAGLVVRALPDGGVRVMVGTLPSSESLPHPDCWVRRRDATQADAIGMRLASWRPEDVLLVIEVSDESVVQDLTVKATLYAQSGYAVYWVVTREGIHEHTEPTTSGYARQRTYRPGDRMPVAYATSDLEVADLLAR